MTDTNITTIHTVTGPLEMDFYGHFLTPESRSSGGSCGSGVGFQVVAMIMIMMTMVMMLVNGDMPKRWTTDGISGRHRTAVSWS